MCSESDGVDRTAQQQERIRKARRRGLIGGLVAAGVVLGVIGACGALFLKSLDLGSLNPDTNSYDTGWIVDALGDVDGDGVGDFALHTRFDPVDESDAPSSYVLSGATWSAIRSLQFVIAPRMHARTFEPVDPGEPYVAAPSNLVAVGDVDDDGLSDYCVSLEEDSTQVDCAGTLRMISGGSGATIWEVLGTTQDGRLGRELASIGDLDGDGRPDLLASVRGWEWRGSPGRIELRSSANGALLGEIEGPRVPRPTETSPHAIEHQSFGGAICALGDVDADGVTDFAVGASGVFRGDRNAGAVFAYSSRTRELLWSCAGDAGQWLGFRLETAGDLDGDGSPDLYARRSPRDVLAISGANGNPIATHSPWERISHLGDLDADGAEEAFGVRERELTATVLTGATLRSSWSIAPALGYHPWRGYFNEHGSLHDVDGDGVRDVFAASNRILDYRDHAYVPDFGVLRIHSGRNGTILRELTRDTLREFMAAGCPRVLSPASGGA